MNSIMTCDGVTYERSASLRCPCCYSLLFVSVTGASGPTNPVQVFCAAGFCPSIAMNYGAAGVDIEEAVKKLRQKLDKEEECRCASDPPPTS
jgi:hypothetical protein